MSGLFERAALGRHGENDVYIGTVNGQTVVSYFADLHQTGNEAKRVEGSKPRSPATREQIEVIHKLAALVSKFYPDAIGELPALPEPNITKEAA